MGSTYNISATSYLWRAKQRLAEDTPEALFYAAFELRCGIEQRMREYLSVRDDISQKRKQGWQIAKLGADLDRVFRSNYQIAEISFLRTDGTTQFTLRYVPVRHQLRKMAERLGDLLHASKEMRAADDPWWLATRGFLEAVVRELEVASSGTLLGPPLMNKQTGELRVNAVIDESDLEIARSTFARIGARTTLKVSYLEFPDT